MELREGGEKMPLEKQTAAITKALALLTSDEADAIIGEPGDEYQVLIQGAEAMSQLLWALAVNNGVRKKKAVVKMWAQGQVMLLQLVHTAFAMGMRWEAEGGGRKRWD